MNSKLFRCTLRLCIIPAAGVLLILGFRNYPAISSAVLVLATLAQFPVVFLSKKMLLPYIRPDFALLARLGVPFVPLAYEPGRFRVDARISSVLTWLSAFVPLLVWGALQFPEEITVSVLNFATYTTPSLAFLFSALLAMLVGVFAFPFWFESSRAAAMYSAGSERQRYQLRGFADYIEKRRGLQAYETARRAAASAEGRTAV